MCRYPRCSVPGSVCVLSKALEGVPATLAAETESGGTGDNAGDGIRIEQDLERMGRSGMW